MLLIFFWKRWSDGVLEYWDATLAAFDTEALDE
jgi:hypothetical protein